MLPSEITAISVVPPPISIAIFPEASSTSSPAPMAVAIDSSIKKAFPAPASSVAFLSARRSTSVALVGIPTITVGFIRLKPPSAWFIKYFSIAMATS
ncbi:hypothetical protein SDC9_200057 [bioreactor metagenome]|uniref:Uncharacterized protein n=1 Tax=bioreactor metagenome TaxID=1076179 RepID=A0A645IMV9_9ZZZZ